MNKKLGELEFKRTEWNNGQALLDVSQMVYLNGAYVNMHIHRVENDKNDRGFGLEIYFYKKPNFQDGHYNSRYYRQCKGIPQKYWPFVNAMIKAHEEHFGPIHEETC